jgi:hypothetical protein
MRERGRMKRRGGNRKEEKWNEKRLQRKNRRQEEGEIVRKEKRNGYAKEEVERLRT